MKHANKVRPEGPPAAIKQLVAQLNTHIIDKIIPHLPTIEYYGSTYPSFYKDIEKKQNEVLLNIKNAKEDTTKPEELFSKVNDGMIGLAISTLESINNNPKIFSPELVKVAKELIAYGLPIDETNQEKFLAVTHDTWQFKVLGYLQNGEVETPSVLKNTTQSLILKEELKLSEEELNESRKKLKQNNSGEDRAKAAKTLQTALDNAIKKIGPFTTAHEENDQKFANVLHTQLAIVKNIVSTSDRLIAQTEANLKKQKNEGRG